MKVTSTISRAATSLAGPLAFAGANFLLMLCLQQSVDAHTFGLFAFGQVVIALGISISNGLFGAPAIVIMALGGEDERRPIRTSFFWVNFAYSLLFAAFLFLALGIAGGEPSQGIALGCLGFLMWFRWFLRSIELAEGRRKLAAVSDIAYGGIALTAVATLLVFGRVDFMSVVLAQSLAAVAGTVALGTILLASVSGAVSASPFFSAFRDHGRWAVASNAMTDVATNFHAYLVTLVLGPAAFAPLALATLLFRPLGVVLTGLVQFERPRMARTISEKNEEKLRDEVGFIRLIVSSVWAVNVLVVVGVCFLIPESVFKPDYPARDVVIALLLTSVVTLLRGTREPNSAAMQAAGKFRELASIAIRCAPLTVLGAVTAVLLFPSIAALTLVGIAASEVVNLMLVRARYKQLVHAFAS